MTVTVDNQKAAEGTLPVSVVVLTYNEEANLRRCLDSVQWAARIVVLDSGSTDRTEEIARQYANVAWYQRPFDRHAAQWEYGVRETGIETEYVLALDADMSVTPAFVAEFRQFLGCGFAGAIVPFSYRILDRQLLGSIYPSQLRIFRPAQVRITQPGHTQEFAIEGQVHRFRSRVIHDDRKPTERWVRSQIGYARLEAARMAASPGRRLRDRLRHLGWMPAITGLVAYLRAGGPLRGAAALRYAYERATFECLLAMILQESASKTAAEDTPPSAAPAKQMQGQRHGI